ncbi:hypothetical protein [Paraburkholderia gardini]|uniref:hypothetical protein n=1 Tax=Paraburkholderia gardini TaxID=2823469 RepID=UPI001DB9F875|nr:hypothetical protein [Paraburkholderia gardini]CAG4914110.1 hypothetical protein R69919_04167 [Paraburkholderia gardini]
MSDKFDMKLVIDSVTTPLLHARLTAAGSARERAALLRSLAESTLRASEDYRTTGARFTSASQPDTPWHAAPPGVEDRDGARAPAHIASADVVAVDRPAVSSEATIDAFDPDAIGDQFAAFY